ncbi:unnamed protein product, partial [marine sediment metagenome]
IMEEDWKITISCIESPDQSFIGYQKVFTSSPIAIGRAENNDMVIPDPAASRNHAILRITTDYSRVFITDMSTHGTEVSGKVVPKGRGSGFTIENGDTIKIGQTVLQYELQLKSSVQSTMIGEIDRSFLDKPPEPAAPKEPEPAPAPAPAPVPQPIQAEDTSKKYNPVYIGIIVVCLIVLLYLIFGG